MGRVFHGTSDAESRDHRRPGSEDRDHRRTTARCHVGPGRHHRLRDLRTGNRPAARVGGRRRAHRADEARSRARGKRSLVARVPAWRRSGALHDHSGAGGIENAQIAVLDLRTGTSKVLIRGGSHAQYVPTGHLVYGVAGTLRAVAFDLGRLEVVSTPVPVLEGVVTTAIGAANARWPPTARSSTSQAWPPAVASGRSCRWIARDAPHRCLACRRTRTATCACRPMARGSPSPPGTDVWTYDFARATRSRLTTDPAADRSPLWTPDGQRIVFTSTRAGYPELFWRPADGTGSDERLLARAKDSSMCSPAAGRQTANSSCSARCRRVVRTRSGRWPSSARPTRSAAEKRLQRDFAAVSPDGRWMAYQSNVSGRAEIYVERYPQLGSRQLISTDGGHLPLWSRDGRELFFHSLDGRHMLAVAVQPGTTLDAGRPQVLFEAAMLRKRLAFGLTTSPPMDGSHHPQWPDGSRRRHAIEHDPGAELVRRAEAARADEVA